MMNPYITHEKSSVCKSAAVWLIAWLCLLPGTGWVHANTWVPTAGGTYDWNDNANWTPASVPNGIDAVGDVAVDIAGAQTINLNEEITVGTLKFGDTYQQSGGQTIQAGTGGSLVMSVSSGTALIQRKNGNHSRPTTISANIRLDSTTVIDNSNVGGAFELIFSGSISGNGGLTKINASSKPGVYLGSADNRPNTYLGLTTVTGGILYPNKNGVIAIPGDVLISGGILQMNRSNNIADTSLITMESSGRLRLSTTSDSASSDTVGGLVGESAANIVDSYATAGTSTLTLQDEGNRTYAGTLQDGGRGGKLAIVKKGAGFWTITGTNTCTGSTTVDGAGGLIANTTIANSAVLLTGGGTLGGTGVISQSVACVSGTLAPGASGNVGTLTLAGGLTVTNALAYTWQLDSLSESTGYDKIVVSGGTAALGTVGTVTLDFGLLSEADRPDAAELDRFWLIDRSWTIMDATGGSVSGQFASVGNGTGWAGGHGLFSLSGGNGGDVVLNWKAPPPTVTLITIR